MLEKPDQSRLAGTFKDSRLEKFRTRKRLQPNHFLDLDVEEISTFDQLFFSDKDSDFFETSDEFLDY